MHITHLTVRFLVIPYKKDKLKTSIQSTGPTVLQHKPDTRGSLLFADVEKAP
jgi:hypothetical protein